MTIQNNIRKAKLHSRHRAGNSGGDVPWLNISGWWLQELGFKIGDQITITTREKLLIIEVAGNEVQEEAAQYKSELKQLKQEIKKLL